MPAPPPDPPQKFIPREECTTYTYIYIHIYLSIDISIYLSIYINLSIYIYIYMYICMYMNTYIYIYIYIYQIPDPSTPSALQGGCNLRELVAALEPLGLCLPSLPILLDQTVAGLYPSLHQGLQVFVTGTGPYSRGYEHLHQGL